MSPLTYGEEIFEVLMEHKDTVIERIFSCALVDGQWYDQSHDEWVLLTQGSAILEFKDRSTVFEAGDYCFIPAHKVHRVKYTSEDAQWLAIHWGAKDRPLSSN